MRETAAFYKEMRALSKAAIFLRSEQDKEDEEARPKRTLKYAAGGTTKLTTYCEAYRKNKAPGDSASPGAGLEQPAIRINDR